jgi:L-ascorbate metabolism protein UlaG (beta-lactamase superfamily)/rhodanese-related sulfurtransferase
MSMKKFFTGARFLTCLLAMFGLTTACGQQNYENVDVQGFSELMEDPSVVLLDVRTASEFAEGHIVGAILIDQGESDFMEKAKSMLPTDKKIAVYCRSGRRSANAAGRLAAEGYRCVNLKGGVLAWKEAGKVVTTDTYEVDVFKTKSGKTVRFHALVHASIRMEYDGREIEIDPVTKLGNKTIDYTAMPKANIIFVTHEHGDHFDKDAIKLLSDNGTKLITNRRCADMLGSGEVMANGDKKQIADDFTVEAVPAYNYSEGRTQFHPKGRDNGYVLTVDGLRIYIAGDTEDIPEMSGIKDIDIAFLPCNQPYTMTTEQLVKAAKTIKPKVLFPYHYGQTDVSKLPSLLQSDGIDVRIRHYE